jgi:methylmalonyl-CoA/ethylmalonyl-CoA epimerase
VPQRIADLGQIMQLAFVPSDFDATLKFWTGAMGAGPFFVIEHDKPEWAYYRGQRTEPDLTLAIGHWGDMQIEIIQQHNEAASPYRDWRLGGGEGLHHTSILIDDMAKARAVCAQVGAEPVYHGSAGNAEWIYVDTGGGQGTIVEMLRHTPATRANMLRIRDAARDWNGLDPIRSISQLGSH